MRASKLCLHTLRQPPKEAELISHKLLARGNFIERLAAGIYSFLPLGLRVLHKIEAIVRRAMDEMGAQELMMPVLQPVELWEHSGRWQDWTTDAFKLHDRSMRMLCLGPTHEEVITLLAKNYITSYKRLPLLLYQIQTKFRDELRPRGGIIRAREFYMKDLYSFHSNEESLQQTFEEVKDKYLKVFGACGLKTIIIEAEAGPIGGTDTLEFMVDCESGEDHLLYCFNCGYGATPSLARVAPLEANTKKEEPIMPIQKVATPNLTTADEVAEFLNLPKNKIVKTLIYRSDDEIIAVLLPGDRLLSELKLQKLLSANTLSMADDSTIERLTGAPVGFSGPLNLGGIKLIADQSLKCLSNFVVGANEIDAHFINVNLGRDFSVSEFADIKEGREGDPCPRCFNNISERRGIEVGHIFKLGVRFSEKLDAYFIDRDGTQKPVLMGCYGLGISRVMAAVVEVSYDKDGIVWPISIAPFQAIILAIDNNSAELSERLYQQLINLGIEVLLDDRDVSAGIKFKDADLIGIPFQIIVGQKFKKEHKIELRSRKKEQNKPALALALLPEELPLKLKELINVALPP